MDNQFKNIQQKLIASLDRLDSAKENISNEVARSNAISQLANTYIKTCNLIIRVEESKNGLKEKLSGINEK